jgi:arsenite methyltransferase
LSSYLQYKFEDNQDFINTFDEAPLWSAAFGLLLLEHIPVAPYRSVIDIGSGAGFPLMELAGRFGSSCTIYGVDPWKNAMRRAHEKMRNYGYANVRLLECSAENIPLENGSVELAVSNLGINNFDRPDRVFIECARILCKHGRLALTTNINGHWKLFYEIFQQTLKELGKEDSIDKLNEQQVRRGSVQSITSLFAGAGFEVEKVTERNLAMRFLNGSAFLNHHFIKCGWLGSFLEIVDLGDRETAFLNLEKNLNSFAGKNGGLVLDVPMVYIQGQKKN